MSKSDIALVIGNGPSVDALDPAIFGHLTSYGSNHIYKKFSAWGRPTDAVVITDSHRLREIGNAYASFPGKLYVGDERYPHPPVARLRRQLGRDFIALRQSTKDHYPKCWPFNQLRFHRFLYSTVFDKWRFPFDWNAGFNFGQSVVTSAIQIAALNGAKRILLTGVDASYPTEKAYFTGAADRINYVNDRFIKNPRLSMEPYFVMLQICFEHMGVELIDCTPGGALKFIRKGRMEDLVH